MERVARNFKFSVRIDLHKSHLNRDKIPQKRRGQGPVAEFLNFKGPFPKSKMGEARNFKFGIRIDLGKSHLKHDKIPRKWRGYSPVTKKIEF